MKKLLLILLALMFVGCSSMRVKTNSSIKFGSDMSFYNHKISGKSINIYTITINKHGGFKFIIEIDFNDYDYNTEVYGRVFEEDDWSLIKAYDTKRIEYLDKFLYYREIMIVSKTNTFKNVKTKIFVE